MEWNRAFAQTLYDLPAADLGPLQFGIRFTPRKTNRKEPMRKSPTRSQRSLTAERQRRDRAHFPAGGRLRTASCIAASSPCAGWTARSPGPSARTLTSAPSIEAEDALRRSEERLHTLYNVTSRQELVV